MARENRKIYQKYRKNREKPCVFRLKSSHKEHKGREDHKEEGRMGVLSAIPA
jgi:hypothetical protein